MRFSLAFMADIEILTEIAQQVAVRKKNCSGAMGADQRRFFTKMGAVTRDPGFFSGATDAGLTRHTVDPTAARAKLTCFQKQACLFDAGS